MEIALISNDNSLRKKFKKFEVHYFKKLDSFLKEKKKFDIIFFEHKDNENILNIFHDILEIYSNCVFIVIFHEFQFENIKKGLREGIYDFIPYKDLDNSFVENVIERAIEHAKILKSKEKVYEYTKHFIFIKIPSDINLVNETVLQIISTSKSAGFIFSKEVENNIRLALTEGLANAIVHGNKSDKSKHVIIKVFIDFNTLKVKIKDMGKGFILEESKKDILHEDNLLKSHGRGVYLMKLTMDEIYYDMMKKELVLIKYKTKGG